MSATAVMLAAFVGLVVGAAAVVGIQSAKARVIDLAVRVDAGLSALQSRYEAAMGRVGRLAMLAGAFAACAPALGQLVRGEVLEALRTLGEASVMMGLAASLGGKR